MTRRPAAHNPMAWRRANKPPGAPCAVCGCHVYPGRPCEGCAFNAALAEHEAHEARRADPARADIGIEGWEPIATPGPLPAGGRPLTFDEAHAEDDRIRGWRGRY